MDSILPAYGPELSPGRAALLDDIRLRAELRHQALADLSLACAAVAAGAFATAVIPGLLSLELGAIEATLRLSSAALLVLAVVIGDRAAEARHRLR